MAEVLPKDAEVNARIVYWGIEGAGKTTNLRQVYGKLRPDHRGELREMPTRLDPTVSYEVLPIELGEIAGVRTRIQMISAPGAPEHEPTRKQLLDQVDGVVLVVDSQRDRIDENLASFEELRTALAAYGRRLDALPLVVQYNKQDLADPYALEELHRKLDLRGAAVFEAVATEGTGLLETLSTISKRVIRSLREREAPGGDEAGAGAPEPRPPAPAPGGAPAAPTSREPLAPPASPEAIATAAPARAAAPEEGERTIAIAVPTPEDLAASEPSDADPVRRMEQAILAEGEHSDTLAVEDAARDAEALLEEDFPGELVAGDGARLGPDLSIVSVGETVRVDDRAVRVSLVLGDGEGRTSSLMLTIQLDALVDEPRS